MSLVVGFGPNTDQSGALFLLHKMLEAGKAAAAAEHERAIRPDDAAVKLDLSDEAKRVLESNKSVLESSKAETTETEGDSAALPVRHAARSAP